MVTLTPQGRAVAAIALGFALVTGNLNALLYSVLSLFGSHFPDGRGGVVLYSAIAAVIALGVLELARQAAGAEGWAGALVQGASVLVAVYLLLTAIGLVSGLIHNDDGSIFFPGMFGYDGMYSG